MKIVISLGGSVLFSNPKILFDLKNIVKGYNTVIVVGGGSLAREYIEFAGKFHLNENTLHEIGIKSTILNAFIVSKVLDGKLFIGDPRKIKESKLIVMGGFKPGWSTDVDAAYAATAIGAKVLFNLSKEDGVYNFDPNKIKDKRKLVKFKELDAKSLIRLGKGRRKPGMNFIFDPLAARICMRNHISIVITSSVEDIKNYIDGRNINGTLVRL